MWKISSNRTSGLHFRLPIRIDCRSKTRVTNCNSYPTFLILGSLHIDGSCLHLKFAKRYMAVHGVGDSANVRNLGRIQKKYKRTSKMEGRNDPLKEDRWLTKVVSSRTAFVQDGRPQKAPQDQGIDPFKKSSSILPPLPIPKMTKN